MKKSLLLDLKLILDHNQETNSNITNVNRLERAKIMAFCTSSATQHVARFFISDQNLWILHLNFCRVHQSDLTLAVLCVVCWQTHYRCVSRYKKIFNDAKEIFRTKFPSSLQTTGCCSDSLIVYFIVESLNEIVCHSI